MRRHALDGTGAVPGDDVVRNPNRHALVRKRIERVGARKDALLLHQTRALEFRLGFETVGECFNRGALAFRYDLFHERMLGCEHDERDAVKRIQAGREGFERGVRLFDLPAKRCAFTASDPIALHRARTFRPTLEPI